MAKSPKEIKSFNTRLEQSTGFVMMNALNSWQSRLSQTFQDSYGVNVMDYQMLCHIEAYNNSQELLTQTTLTLLVGSDAMTVSKMLRLLDQRKYIKRKEHPVDTRAKTVELTDKGKKLLNELTTEVEKCDKEILGSSGTRNQLHQSLQQVLKNI
jgi:DNA-binding MarR family transcriptional regulator